MAATYVAHYVYNSTGAELKDALHYLNADSNGTKITNKVTNVTFGLTEDYAEIANTYTGVAADAGQDRPVYAYYVPNGDQYDIYVLSDAAVYAPQDSSELFRDMTSLQTADLRMLDVSRVEQAKHLFSGCSKVTQIDATGWDTSSVSTFDGMFNDCYSLEVLDLSSFDTSAATTLAQMFEGCASLTKIIGIENWDVSNVTTTKEMFSNNGKNMLIAALDLSGWNTVSLKTTSSMFNGCGQLKTICVGDGWNVAAVTNSGSMFAGCNQLVGGNGTTISGNPIDATYACVDTEATPGYLTYKAN